MAAHGGCRQGLRPRALPIPEGFTADSVGLFAGQGSKIAIESITFTQEPVPEDLMSRWADPDSLDRHLTRSTDLIEGYWRIVDSTLKTPFAFRRRLRTGNSERRRPLPYRIPRRSGDKPRPVESRHDQGELQPTAFGGIFDLHVDRRLPQTDVAPPQSLHCRFLDHAHTGIPLPAKRGQTAPRSDTPQTIMKKRLRPRHPTPRRMNFY